LSDKISDDIPTVSIWRVLSATFITEDPQVDVMALTVAGNGREYGVAISGHKGMQSTDFIPALRAACAGLLVAVGVDPGIVGAAEHDPENAIFDTGSQRAN
jgi:hypothetical protein